MFRAAVVIQPKWKKMKKNEKRLREMAEKREEEEEIFQNHIRLEFF